MTSPEPLLVLGRERPVKSMSAKTIAPDPQAYATMYLRFLTMKRAFKHLNHAGTEPQPKDFGLTEGQAALERVKVEREYSRKF